MIGNYLKIALRNLWRQKGYTAINLTGLAVGIACCVLIMLFVRDEWSFDRFHEDADQLYRAWVEEDYGEGQVFFNVATPVPLAPALEANFPEVEQTVRLQVLTELVGPPERRFSQRVHFVDPAFFELFSFPLVQGQAETVLADQQNVVLTEELAEFYFGSQNPVGETLTVFVDGEPQDFTVTGIAEAPPSASSIQFDLLVPYAHFEGILSEGARQSWHQVYGETYVLLREGVTGASVEERLPALVNQHVSEQARDGYTLGLQPITDIHLNTAFPTGLEPISDPRYSYILSAIAFLILIIASINFVTLSVGQSMQRAREVGVRKALGARRSEVMRQFWGEGLLVTGLAIGLGFVLAFLLLPFFNTLAGRELVLRLDAATLAMLGGLFLVVGLGAGGYPALMLSSFEPVKILRGRLQFSGQGSGLRQGLVVVQFVLAILIITGTLVISQQLRYLQTTNLGYDAEQVVVIPTGVDAAEALPIIERFRNAVADHEMVIDMTASVFALNEGWLQAGYTDDQQAWRSFRFNIVEADYLEAMGIDEVAGRGFSSEISADSSRIVVNEALVRDYGWSSPQAAIGRSLPGPNFPDHEIVGVVQDFHFESLHSEIAPLVLSLNGDILEGASDMSVSSSTRRKLSVRVQGDDIPAAVALLSGTWDRVAGDLPFDYYFLDDALQAQYVAEERLGNIASTASLLSILIACLGLFGLAAFVTTRRTKEIGVRKVLGATAMQVVALLSKDFARLVIIAFVVAAPIGYLLMNWWLQDFAYRIELGPGIFVGAGVLALAIALGTVSYHAIRTALSDPVKSLRYE